MPSPVYPVVTSTVIKLFVVTAVRTFTGAPQLHDRTRSWKETRITQAPRLRSGILLNILNCITFAHYSTEEILTTIRIPDVVLLFMILSHFIDKPDQNSPRTPFIAPGHNSTSSCPNTSILCTLTPPCLQYLIPPTDHTSKGGMLNFP